MITRAALTSAIKLALETVGHHQQPNGSFLAYLPDDTIGHATTFTPSLIGLALASTLPKTAARPILAPLARFLRQELSPARTVNYWPRDSKLAKLRPYPDDLDDTFCALGVLHWASPTNLTPADFAAIIKLLVAQETSVGGPYRTWATGAASGAAWHDVDLAVNANVAYFLSLQDMELPNLTAFAEMAILNRTFTSNYYPSEYPVIYFLARFYHGAYSDQLADYLTKKLSLAGTTASPTDTALAISALLRLGQPAATVAPAIEYLLQAGGPHGWQPGPVYIEENGRTIQSPALTAALVCEALALYRQTFRRAPRHQVTSSRTATSIYRGAVQQVRARFQSLDSDFRQAADQALGELLRHDPDQQMALLPYLWAESCGLDAEARPVSSYTELGAASLFGWLAYTIYDDFLDNEGRPQLLPVANIALRELSEIFYRQFKDGRSNFLKSLLDQMESANSWELANCRAIVSGSTITINRLPNYENYQRLAQRSLGHALGPLCLLLHAGHSTDSVAVTQTLTFFEHYLIARQLNDDVHDWESDLQQGQINAVAVSLLKSLGRRSIRRANLPRLLDKLRTQLWRDEILNICLLITHHTHMARASLQANPALQNTAILEALLAPIEASAASAAEGHNSTTAFLKAYHEEIPS